MTTPPKPPLRAAIDGSPLPQVVFRPNREFYKTTGIGRKRFGALYRGEKSPLLSELEAIAQALGKRVTDFISPVAQPE